LESVAIRGREILSFAFCQLYSLFSKGYNAPAVATFKLPGTSNEKSPTRGLTVIAASLHGLLRSTCNHSHKLLAAGSVEIKPSGFW